MKALGVIPARWGSTRFEGKVLAMLNGKPLVRHVWERARQSRLLDDCWIACDDDRVQTACEAFGARVVRTSVGHASGTDRIAEAVMDVKVDIVVNIQGDEPFIDPGVLDELVAAIDREKCPMATVVQKTRDEAEILSPNVVKVVLDQEGYALYFSRAPIPCHRDTGDFPQGVYYKHWGIYAYQKAFLDQFHRWPPSMLEQTEKLEQLRALEAGYRIKTIVTDKEGLGVDTPEDLALAEARLKRQEEPCHEKG